MQVVAVSNPPPLPPKNSWVCSSVSNSLMTSRILQYFKKMHLIQNITIKEANGLLHSPEKHFLTLNKPQKIYHYPSTEFKKFKDHYLPFDKRVVLYLTFDVKI